MTKNNFELMFSNLEKGIYNNQKKAVNDSKVKVYLVPTNEELMIAKETERVLKN